MTRRIAKLAARLFAWESRLLIRRHRPKVVAVTGSVGKTTTKDLIATVLRERFRVRHSPGNFNANVLVPLAVLGLPDGGRNPLIWLANAGRGLWRALKPGQPEWLVLEIAAGHPGEIDWVAGWLATDVVVLTHFPEVPAHLEAFGSRERLFEEKCLLLATLQGDGIVVVNADDPDLMGAVRRGADDRRIVTYGVRNPAEIRGRRAETVYDQVGRHPLGIELEIEADGGPASVFVPGILGTHHLYAALAAVATAVTAGIRPEAAIAAIAGNEFQPGRMRILAGIRGSVIIDDAFNASPAAADQALACLGSLDVPGRRIAVLGEMTGLGKLVDQEHRKLGGRAAAASDLLLAVGAYADRIVEGARGAGVDEERARRFEGADGPGEGVAEIIDSGDVVLVKGSGLRAVVERLSRRPGAPGDARDGEEP